MGATGQNYPDQRSQHGEHCIQSGSYVRIGATVDKYHMHELNSASLLLFCNYYN